MAKVFARSGTESRDRKIGCPAPRSIPPLGPCFRTTMAKVFAVRDRVPRPQDRVPRASKHSPIRALLQEHYG